MPMPPEHRDCVASRNRCLVDPPVGLVKRSKAETTARFERPHLERAGQRECLTEALAGFGASGGLPRGGHLGLQT
jgi:hypothetical protein